MKKIDQMEYGEIKSYFNEIIINYKVFVFCQVKFLQKSE